MLCLEDLLFIHTVFVRFCHICFDLISPLRLFLHLSTPVHSIFKQFLNALKPICGNDDSASFTWYILTPLCRAPILVMVATKQFRVNLSWCLSLLMNLRVFLCTATNKCKGRRGTGNTSIMTGVIVIQTFTFLLQLSYITNELVASVQQKAPEVQRL